MGRKRQLWVLMRGRTFCSQHGVLSQQFVELINKCNSMQSEYREKNVERIRRQLKISELEYLVLGVWGP